MNDRVRINTTLDRELWEVRLKQFAEQTGVERNRVIEKAVNEYLIEKQYEILQEELTATCRA